MKQIQNKSYFSIIYNNSCVIKIEMESFSIV